GPCQRPWAPYQEKETAPTHPRSSPAPSRPQIVRQHPSPQVEDEHAAAVVGQREGAGLFGDRNAGCTLEREVRAGRAVDVAEIEIGTFFLAGLGDEPVAGETGEHVLAAREDEGRFQSAHYLLFLS